MCIAQRLAGQATKQVWTFASCDFSFHLFAFPYKEFCSQINDVLEPFRRHVHTELSDVNMRNMRKMFSPLPPSRRYEVKRVLSLVHLPPFISQLHSFTTALSPSLYLPHTRTHATAGACTHPCAGEEEEARMSTLMKNEFISTPLLLKTQCIRSAGIFYGS